MALEREVRQFKLRLPDLLGADDVNEGKYAVVKGDTIDGPFDEYQDALGFGYGRHGPTSFLVEKIERRETMTGGRDEPGVLHVWGPSIEHDSLTIVANREGLLALRAAVDRALSYPLDSEGQSVVGSPEPMPCTRDGECFDIHIWRDDRPWRGPDWQSRSFPYTGLDYLDCDVPELPAYPVREPTNLC